MRDDRSTADNRSASHVLSSRSSEAALYIALISVPAYFTVFSQRVFEAEKAGLLRFVAIIGACALLSDKVGSSRAHKEPNREGLVARVSAHPLIAAAALLLSIEALSSLFSIVPWTSLFGSYARGLGLLSMLSFAVFALIARQVAGRPGGRSRLSMVIAVSGTFPALYGVLQSYGLDPLPWDGDVVTRVVGSAGNSVMLAAQLVMTLPFACLEALRAWRGGSSDRFQGLVWKRSAWLCIAGLQLWALVLSASRGPLLGLIAAVGLCSLAWAAGNGNRRLAHAVVVAAILGTGLILALNVEGLPLGSLRQVPVLDRLSTSLDPERSTTRVRLRLWEGSVEAFVDRPERMILGHGPESMDRFWARYYPPILAYDEPRGYVPDRAHNLVLDRLLNQGIAGLIAQLLLFAALAAACLRRLLPSGVPRPSRGGLPRSCWAASSIGAAAGLLTTGLLDADWRLAGLGLGLGLWLGFAAWLWRQALRPVRRGAAGEPESLAQRGFALASLAALSAHYLELQVGFALVGSSLILWTLVGAWSVHATQSLSLDMEALGSEQGEVDRVELGWLVATSLGLVVLFSLARPGLVGDGVGSVALLLVASTLLVAMALARLSGTFVRVWVPTLTAYAMLRLTMNLRLVDPSADVMRWLSIDLFAFGAVLLLVMLRYAHWSTPSRVGGLPRPGWRVSMVWGIGLGLGFAVALGPSLADARFKEGSLGWQAEVARLRSDGKSGKAESYLERAQAHYCSAVRLAPWEPAYRLAQARLAVEWADLLDARLARRLQSLGSGEGTREPSLQALEGQRDAQFEAAIEAGQRARDLSGDSPLPILTLARSWRVWGELSRDPTDRGQRLERASATYAEAARLAPGWPEILLEAAAVAMSDARPEEAIDLCQRSLELDPFYREAWLGMAEANVALPVPDHAAAAEAYREYFDDYRNASDLEAQRGWMVSLSAVARLEEAIVIAERLVDLKPGNAGALADLAALLAQDGRPDAARAAAREAQALAPDDAAIEQLLESLHVGP